MRTCAGGSEWVYTALLTLEDATAEVDARLVGALAERFFQGMPPVDLKAGTQMHSVVPNAYLLTGTMIRKYNNDLGEHCDAGRAQWNVEF